MVDAHERLAGSVGKALGEGDANHERAHQARALCHAHGGKLAGGNGSILKTKRCCGILERRIHDTHNHLDVFARGDLGHHAAEARMEVDLRGHDVGDKRAVAVDDGGRRLVAGRFDGEDEGAAFGCFA